MFTENLTQTVKIGRLVIREMNSRLTNIYAQESGVTLSQSSGNSCGGSNSSKSARSNTTSNQATEEKHRAVVHFSEWLRFCSVNQLSGTKTENKKS